ncbi:hypothetical protein DFH09DRAFT_335151 [Mycena vulgaris]|nr:hypothetical protein DFH09DRAFT_335151 [Mycena vulgaris]
MDPPPPTPSSSWPRRTAKACSNCRRDKVRCDGTRPCSGCTKKNKQCVDGCDPCRRARARCEKTGNSCTRCEAEKIECVEEERPEPSPVSFFVPQRQSPPPSPNPRERAKSACQNCKNDNKKCDDQRPCSRCVARSEACVPIARAPSTRVKLRCEACRKNPSSRCDDARPCQNCVAAGLECVNLVRQGRGCGTRVKGACISCRRNKIRCDGARPCSSCIRRGSECLEQACKRCAQSGLKACTHRSQRDHRDSAGETSTRNETQSTSNVAPAPAPFPSQPSAMHNPAYYSWPVSGPSMFAPMHPPGHHGPAYLPVSPPHATSSTRSDRD